MMVGTVRVGLCGSACLGSGPSVWPVARIIWLCGLVASRLWDDHAVHALRATCDFSFIDYLRRACWVLSSGVRSRWRFSRVDVMSGAGGIVGFSGLQLVVSVLVVGYGLVGGVEVPGGQERPSGGARGLAVDGLGAVQVSAGEGGGLAVEGAGAPV